MVRLSVDEVFLVLEVRSQELGVRSQEMMAVPMLDGEALCLSLNTNLHPSREERNTVC